MWWCTWRPSGRGLGRGERGQPESSSRCKAARDNQGETVAGYQIKRWSNTCSGTGAGASSRLATGSAARPPQGGGAGGGIGDQVRVETPIADGRELCLGSTAIPHVTVSVRP